MDADALITSVIGFWDNVDANDASNVDRRSRILTFLQITAGEVWNYRDWAFKARVDTSLVTTGGLVEVPADFGEIGQSGGVFLTDTGAPLLQVDPKIVIEMMQGGTTNNLPTVYALFGQGTNGLLQLFVPGDGVNLTLYYSATQPVITDAGAPSGMEYIPLAYHYTVMLTGTAAKAQQSKGDARPDWNAMYQNGLMQMVARERLYKPSVRKMPVTVGGKW